MSEDKKKADKDKIINNMAAQICEIEDEEILKKIKEAANKIDNIRNILITDDCDTPITVKVCDGVTTLCGAVFIERLLKIDIRRIGNATADSPGFFPEDKVSEMIRKKKAAHEYVRAVKIIMGENDEAEEFGLLLDEYKWAMRYCEGPYTRPLARLKFIPKIKE